MLSTLRQLLCPPPVTPMFQPGGFFESFNEDVTLTLLGMGALFVVDNLIVKPFIKPKARYFALHAFANAVGAVASAPEVVKGLTLNPVDTFGSPASTMIPNSIVAAIHLYHCVAFPLRAEDIFHHLTFCSVLCGSAIVYKRMTGVSQGWGCFFLSGFPGGLDYLMLVAVQHGLMDKMTEKKWCARINVWLRGPSTAVYLFLAWTSWYHNALPGVHPLLHGTFSLIHYLNGQYYCQQAVENYAIHKERERNESAQR